MDKKINNSATDYLRGLKRVSSVKEAKLFEEDVLLLPENIDIIVEEDSNVRTIGFDRSKALYALQNIRLMSKQIFLILRRHVGHLREGSKARHVSKIAVLTEPADIDIRFRRNHGI